MTVKELIDELSDMPQGYVIKFTTIDEGDYYVGYSSREDSEKAVYLWP